MFENIKNKFQRKPSKFPDYKLLYFDHLHSEYCLLVPLITDEEDKKRLDEIQNRRETESLTWDDIYSYELTLLKYHDFEPLKSKVWSLRDRYRHIAGQSEYDKYLASKAVNLATINGEAGEKELQMDYTYLLREFCLLYSFTAAREGLRDQLLKKVTVFTLGFFLIALLIVVLTPFYNDKVADLIGGYKLNLSAGVATLFVVIFAGMTGAFVSMQQRIQSAPSQGDPLYNLSMLTHGWFSILLSPLSGAIFALILYMLFVSGLVSGHLFPIPRTFTVEDINSAKNPSISLFDFLSASGAINGVGYGKLLIWSFIAGFAERFVPDKLNKLVARDETEKPKQT
ncbi:MAG TPA: hypothetical protein VGB02_16380 [Pyrinomonadaceae bacterium]|jgi:uncharacterized membrane protein